MEALGAFGMVRYMVFFVIDLKSRAVEIAGIAVDPGEKWMKQVAGGCSLFAQLRVKPFPSRAIKRPDVCHVEKDY